MKDDSELDAAVSAAVLDHAWKWFEYHSNQRISLLRFFLLTTGAIATAYAAAFQAGAYLLSIGAALFGVVASFCFLRLDQRAGQLIKLGEAVLDREQQRLEGLVKHSEMLIIQESEKKEPGWFRSYRQILRLLFVATLAIYGIGVALAASRLLPYSPEPLAILGPS